MFSCWACLWGSVLDDEALRAIADSTTPEEFNDARARLTTRVAHPSIREVLREADTRAGPTAWGARLASAPGRASAPPKQKDVVGRPQPQKKVLAKAQVASSVGAPKRAASRTTRRQASEAKGEGRRRGASKQTRKGRVRASGAAGSKQLPRKRSCLLYTSDAADE